MLLNNAHITQGGEIEKRKAFVRLCGLANTFGMLATSDTIIVFGSVDPSSVVIPVGVPITYQQLVHPVNGISMTGVVDTALFGNKAFVISAWSNGDVLEYYDSALVTDFVYGEQNSITPNALAVANSLLDEALATGKYTVIRPASGTDTVSFSILSVPTQSSANPFSVAVTASDASLTYQLVSNGVPSSAPASAVGQFAVTVGGSNSSASGVLTFSSGNAINNEVVVIGTTTYTFVTFLTGTPFQVLIGATGLASLANLVSAINGSSGSGATYSVGTTANTQVSSTAVVGSTITVTAIKGGLSGNSVATTTTSVALSWGSATLTGGGSLSKASLTSDNTAPANASVVTINGKAYTFQTSLTAGNGHVAIGASADIALTNLLLAINLTGTAGTNYGTGTTKNTDVTAINYDTTNHKLLLQAIMSGAAGDALTLAQTGTTHLTLSGAVFSGGATDANQITQIIVGVQNLLASYVPFNKDITQTAADLVTAINAYSGTSGFSATNSVGVVTLTAVEAGSSVNEAVVTVQTLGNVCIADCFYLFSGTGSIQGITANSVPLMTSILTFRGTGYSTETIAQFVTRVVLNINANSSVSGYQAYSNSNQMWISASNVASDADAVDVEATTDTTLLLRQGSTTGLKATNNTNSISFVRDSSGFTYSSINNPNSAVISVTGGVPPYSYSWFNTGGLHIARPNGGNAPNQWWTVTLNNPKGTETWSCTITDSDSPTPSSLISNPFYLILP